ncbi:MAG: ABC transporter substrate-binding protein [Cyclobacteriaceae bacterium]|nr:ABC transporter substrate-binding protein [Cyclobacteriaceae bacterium]UYN86377.1 MAG: ABC transporter substrate-binding protein [Cyclobacteriaceae bacterium]
MVTKTFVDQMGSTVRVPEKPKRIVSLVPSQTELLASLGLNNEVVGITKFCIHPKCWLKEKAIVGGTKNFHFDTIDELRPDLVIGNKEENYQAGIQELQARYPVWMSDIEVVEDAIKMIDEIGRITTRESEAANLIGMIQDSFRKIDPLPPLRVLYLMWRKPWMGVAQGTFINSMLQLTGLRNCVTQAFRYPELSDDDIRSLKPDLIFLSSEPYPFKKNHMQEIQSILPACKVILVNGEMFSWYGSRMQLFGSYVNNLRSQII